MQSDSKLRRAKFGRAAALILLIVVVALAFIGHLSPTMRLQWADFVALCGF